MKIIVGCRHGEAYKNLKDIYGGEGSGLTPKGKEQILEAVQQIKQLQEKHGLPVRIYLSCQRGQIVESGEIIRQQLNIDEVRLHEKYKPIRLGLFNGMSRQEQKEKFPDALVMHSKWEQGEIDITQSEKLVPGMQKALDYYNQTKQFISELEDNCIHVLVGTRSDLSCVLNVFKSNTPQVYMAYKYFPLDYAQLIMQVYDESKKETDVSQDVKTSEKTEQNTKDEAEHIDALDDYEDEIELGE